MAALCVAALPLVMLGFAYLVRIVRMVPDSNCDFHPGGDCD